jgi:hypothetical protein
MIHCFLVRAGVLKYFLNCEEGKKRTMYLVKGKEGGFRKHLLSSVYSITNSSHYALEFVVLSVNRT